MFHQLLPNLALMFLIVVIFGLGTQTGEGTDRDAVIRLTRLFISTCFILAIYRFKNWWDDDLT